MKFTKQLAAISIMLGLVFVGGSAYAKTPANALLKNTASLTYTGSAGAITADVTVTVSLVKASAVILGSAPADVTLTENQSYTETYKIIAQANGPDTYAATVNGAPTNVTGSATPTVSVTTGTGPTAESAAGFVLGASALAVAEPGGETVIRIPDDNTPGVGDVNGLAVADVIVFDGSTQEWEITGITYPGGTDLAELTLAPVGGGGATVPALGIGTGIFEVAEVTTTVTDIGSKDTGPADPELDVNLEIAPTTGANPGNTFNDSVTISIEELGFLKLVRNVTLANDCETLPGFAGGTAVTSGGEKYCSQGVEALPGHVLEYLIQVTNSGGTDIADTTLADVLDEFTSYNPSTTAMQGIDVNDDGSAPIFPLDSANAGGLKLQSSGYAVPAADGTGVVVAGETVEVTYRVTVNNLDI